MDHFYSLTADPRDRVFKSLPLSTTLPSMTAWADKARENISASRFDHVAIEELYRTLYRKHFGRTCPTDLEAERNQTVFRRVRLLTLKEDIDLETYISGNMHAMEQWLRSNPSKTFQPNMLSGPKALRRYEIYAWYANRRRSGGAEAFDAKTAIGKLRTSLFLSEVEVGHIFCSATLHGLPLTWSAATERARLIFGLSADWLALTSCFRHSRQSDHFDSLARSYGVSYLHQEFDLMEASAAVSVLRRFRPALPDILGCREFSWTSLAALLPRIVPVSQRINIKPRVAGTTHWSAL